MLTVMGIDQSLRCTGVFWLGNDILGWREVIPNKLRGAERLLFIKQAVMKCVDDIKPSLVALEGYSYGSAGKVFELGEIGGVLRVALEERNVPTVIVAPTQVKKFMTANHQAEKEEMVEAVNKRLHLGWTRKENNLADASGLAYVALGMLDPSKLVTRHEIEVIVALTKARDTSPEKKTKARRKHKFPKM